MNPKKPKFTVIRTIFRFIVLAVLSVLEFSVRAVIMLMPIGLAVLVLQMQEKPQSTSALHLRYPPQTSTWQTVGSGCAIICQDGKQYKRSIQSMTKKWLRVEPLVTRSFKLATYILVTILSVNILFGLFVFKSFMNVHF